MSQSPSSPSEVGPVRELQQLDLPAMERLEQLCSPLPWSEEMLRAELDRDPGCQLGVDVLVDTHPVLVGMLLAARVADAWHLMNIAVEPALQRTGLATRLMAAFVYRLGFDIEDVGCTLEVRVSNRPAIALYERWDFEPCGIRPAYYANNREDALIMWRPPVEVVRKRAAGQQVDWSHP